MESVDAVGYYGLDQYFTHENGPSSKAVQLKHCSTPKGRQIYPQRHSRQPGQSRFKFLLGRLHRRSDSEGKTMRS